MTDYPYAGTLIADPITFQRAANAMVTVYDANDTNNTTPLALKDTSGLPMANPVRSSGDAFIPPMICPTEGRKLVAAGGLTVVEFSHEGMRLAAEAAAEAAQEASNSASTAASQAVAGASVNDAGELVIQQAGGTTLNAGPVRGAKGDKGDKGDKGADGANVLPTDAAIKQAITTPGTETATALNATIASVAGPPTNGLQEFVGLVRSGQRDLNILAIGDSTTYMTDSWAFQLPDLLAEQFPTHTVVEHLWDNTGGTAFLAPTTRYTGTGARTIHVWNAGAPGKTWTYQLNAVRRNTIMGTNPDLIFFNHGHNLTNQANPDFTNLRDVAVAAIERFRAQAPNAAVVLFSQNPRTDYPGNAEKNGDIYRRIAAERGYGFIDVNNAFWRDGRAMTTLVDILHPTTAGFAIWVNEVRKALKSQPESQALPRQKPSLFDGGRNYVPNGELDFLNPPTLDQWVVSNVTLTKDTTPGLLRSKSYVIKASKTTTTSGAQLYAVLPIAALAGKTVTATVPMYIPAGSYANTGQIQFRTNAGILYSGYTDASTEMRDQWTYRTLTVRVPETATYLRLYINVDPSSGANVADMYLDQVFVTVGTYPTETAIVPPPAAAPAPGSVDVQAFTASGTWTKLPGAKNVRVDLVAGGGGGGSGRRGAAGTVRTGGAGGGGGGLTSRLFPASALTDTVAVTVGAGGTGGAAITANDTGGASGTVGGVTSFGAYARATGGGAGGAGGTGAATGGGGATGTSSGGAGSGSSATGAAPSNASSPSGGPGGGGAGGGITTGDVPSAGSAGASVVTVSGLGQGAGGAVDSSAGAATASPAGSAIPGPGGGGGGASITTAGGAGTAGAIYGAGGGGGGASLNGNNSGAGGDGAPGMVLVTTYF